MDMRLVTEDFRLENKNKLTKNDNLNKYTETWKTLAP